MPQRGRKLQAAAATSAAGDAVSSQSSAVSQAKTPGQDVPSASPRKRGRPRKGESKEKHTAITVAASEDEVAMKETNDDKAAAASSTKPDTSSSGDAFSPRRSGRGVVFNRRFQDMELDFGRKRSKDSGADEPSEKRARTHGKKESGSKGPKTQIEGSGKGKGGTHITGSETSRRVTNTGTAHSIGSDISSQPFTVISPSTAITSTSLHPTSRQISLPATALQSTATSQSNPLQSSRRQTGVVQQSLAMKPLSVKPALSLPPSLSLASTTTSHQGLTLIQTSHSMDSHAMATRTVAITSSRAILAHSASTQEDASPSSLPAEKSSACESSAMKPGNSDSTVPVSMALGSPAEEESVQSSDSIQLENFMDSSSVVDVVVVPGEPGVRRPRVVNISTIPHSSISSEHSSSKTLGETPPGRVVGKHVPETSPTASKSVFIIRNPPGSSVPSEASKCEDSFPAAVQGSPLTAMASSRDAAGDVMSMVEVSPNKKVPVVLAKRKEHGQTIAGKVFKVISAQQIHQLPPALQKIVTSKIAEQKAGKLGPASSTSYDSSLLQDKSSQQTAVTVHVPVSSLTSSASVSVDESSKITPQHADKPTSQNNGEEEQSTETLPTGSNNTAANEQVDVSSDPVEIQVAEESMQWTEKANPSVTTSLAASTEDSGRGEEGYDTPESSSGGDQGQSEVGKVSKAASSNSFSEQDEEDEDNDGDDDDESEEGIPVGGKFATSGTQTPYAKSNTRKVITVHVHPPSKEGEKNREVVTVTKVEREEDDSSDIVDVDERDEMLRHNFGSDSKGKYIVVDLPEGTSVKQPYVRSNDRCDTDPGFYTMDEHGMFVCHMCSYKTYRRPNFYKHKKKHLGLRQYACDVCPYRAATSSNLKRHLEIHKDIRNHKCPMCDLHFRQKIHLERHIKYRHEEKKVKCPLCDYICANENPDLKVHIKRRHIPQAGSAEAMKCPECGIIATSKRDLRQHLKFHSKGPELKLFCNMCSFVTDCESRLRRHQYIHTKEKPFQCGLCEYRGSQKEHVLRHMRTQHNIEISRNRRSKKTEEGEVTKAMERADYTSEEKIFACNHCTMKFSKLINLYKHLHTQHRDIMPSEQTDFSCVVCDFHTTNKKNLLVHMRRHNVTDQSPPSHVYSCVLCRYMNPKRRNLFQHMRKKHHIEIVVRDDGSTTCYVANDPTATATAAATSGLALSPQQTSHGVDSMVSVLPLTDLISTVSQPRDLQVSSDSLANNNSSNSMSTPLKMEDLALVVSNPHGGTHQGGATAGIEVGEAGTLVGTNAVETITIGGLSQDDAAEAIQGLQALAQRGVLEAGPIVEEQVQVMGSDDQTTLVIDPSNFGGVELLVQPKTEPMEVVEIENLDQVTSASIVSQHGVGMLSGEPLAGQPAAPVQEGSGEVVDGGGLQLSAEQLMNLNTGDLLEINGEMFKVEVSSENNPDGSQGQQIISFEPANMEVENCPGDETQLGETEVTMETVEESCT